MGVAWCSPRLRGWSSTSSPPNGTSSVREFASYRRAVHAAPTKPSVVANMGYVGLIAIILICGLFADGLLPKSRIKELAKRVEELEKIARSK